MRTTIAFLLILISLFGYGQLNVPQRLELNATSPEDRFVRGLALPITPDAGVSFEASRDQATTFAVAFGNSIITASLTPTVSAYTDGFVVTLLPSMANMANAQLNIDALGAVPIIGTDGLPVDSARLMPNDPARFIYFGGAFVLLNAAPLGCPDGYTAFAVDACIEVQSHDTIPFYSAVLACAAQGARLCTFAEWTSACLRDPGFMLTVPEMEWVDSAGNNAGNAKTVGSGADGHTLILGTGCKYGAHVPFAQSARYRCCTDR